MRGSSANVSWRICVGATLSFPRKTDHPRIRILGRRIARNQPVLAHRRRTRRSTDSTKCASHRCARSTPHASPRRARTSYTAFGRPYPTPETGFVTTPNRQKPVSADGGCWWSRGQKRRRMAYAGGVVSPETPSRGRRMPVSRLGLKRRPRGRRMLVESLTRSTAQTAVLADGGCGESLSPSSSLLSSRSIVAVSVRPVRDARGRDASGRPGGGGGA